MEPADLPELVTVDTIAKRLRLSRSTAYRMTKDRAFPAPVAQLVRDGWYSTLYRWSDVLAAFHSWQDRA